MQRERIEAKIMSLWWFIFCVMDILMCGSFFDAMFKKRLSGRKYILWILIATLLIAVENTLGITWINLLLVPVIYMIFSKIAYKISMSNCIVYTLIYYVIFAGGREAVSEILYRFISSIANYSIPEWFTPGAIPFLLVEFLVSFLFLLYLKKYMREIKIQENDRICWYLLIMQITSLLIMVNFAYLEFPTIRILQILMCVTIFLLYFSNAVIFIVLARLTQTMNKIKFVELASLKQNLERKNFDRIERANGVYKKFLHDVHQYFYQFRSLAAQGENQVIIGIIDELEGKLSCEENNEFYIASPVLNSLLVEYVNQAKEKKIEISIYVEPGVNVDFISDGDKISIFGNLLSNAIEASYKCKEGKRAIDIKLYMGNRHMLIFRIRNTHRNNLKVERNSFVSTKVDKENHGLGIGIVKELAEKYGGSLEVEKTTESFTGILIVSNHRKMAI